MGKVIVLPELAYKLNDLMITLYKEDYFGFLDSAKEYVITIFDLFIQYLNNVVKKQKTRPVVYGIVNTSITIIQPGI